MKIFCSGKQVIAAVLSVPYFVFILQQGRYKFNSQMRNPPASVQPNVMAQAPPQSVVIPGQEPLTATMLAAAPPQEQKQVSKKAPYFAQETFRWT